MDTDGRNWDRDESRIYANLSYDFLSWMSAGVGFEWLSQDYDNLHDFYFVERDDSATRLFGSLSFRPAEQWEIWLIGVRVNRSSNIPIYAYDRNVVSLGANWYY